MAVKKRLGEMLIEAGAIDEAQLAAALGHQRKWGGKLGQALVDLHFATEEQIVGALSKKFGYDAMDVSSLQGTPDVEAALRLVPRELALRLSLLPVASDSHTLTVAMGDPSNIAVVDELSFRTGKRIRVALAGDRAIAEAVKRLYFGDGGQSTSPSAIALEEAPDVEMETTTDLFAALPDHVRLGYFGPSVGGGGTAADPPRRAASPAQPVAPPPARAPTAAAAPASPARPPAAAQHDAGPARPPRPASPAPVLTRSPPPAPERAAASPRASAPAAAPAAQPVLATDLAIDRRGSLDDAPAPTPKQLALRDALARAARGEESPVTRVLAAALARLLLRKGLVSEEEILEELKRR